MTLLLAEVGFAEASWILVVKSIVIFAAVFAIAPVLTVIERMQGSGRRAEFPRKGGPAPGRRTVWSFAPTAISGRMR